ncbi:pre-piRNA 3'-exonuclease trimmer isoform X2 [Megachile rotundata]|uniref:pre-piRNA 3'-exonuclease trimmer isoform X2 n=1 Tax=Megachile rotundata TaxID=143995 RepID=UPI000614F8EA|nr:PREDICTED: poly(A)-specific ribonuclease PARN-like domain-containing protein 1 isoform X1 [Megachile rotundata]
MNEVLDENFNEVYLQLEKLVNNASFIAIDTELTGISADTEVKYSFFDSLDARYKKLKDTIENFTIIQYGITVFHHAIDMNLYDADCFTFYLLPRSLPLKNKQLTWQVDALEFLSRHNFDFNKLVNHGIPYLNEQDEKSFRQYLKETNSTYKLNHLSYDDETNFKECMNKIQNWLFSNSRDFAVKLEVNNPLVQYLIHEIVIENYDNIRIIPGYKTITLKKVSANNFQEEDNGDLEQVVLDSYIGFSKVFKLLCSSKKPIIGHNVLFDLMFTYQQFYKPLPAQYSEFKRNIHSIFPQIYDTKFLSIELRRLYIDEVHWKQSSLNYIYEFFTSSAGKFLTLNSPTVNLKHTSSDVNNYHNAGWDSFIAGFIFIKVGSVFSLKKYGSGLVERGITHSELLSGVKEFVNSINISRSNEICMKLDADDPMYSKPEWLHVRLKSPTINTTQLVEKLSSFGQVDIMPFARKRVLVAVSNEKSARHILEHFQSSKEFQVARYNRIRHAAPSTICLWSGIVLSSGLFAWVIKQTFIRPS